MLQYAPTIMLEQAELVKFHPPIPISTTYFLAPISGVPGGRVVEFSEQHSLMRSFVDRLLIRVLM